MRRLTLAPVVIMLAVVLLFGGYMGAYYAMVGKSVFRSPASYVLPTYTFDGPFRLDNYRTTFSRVLFWPAHQIDRRIRRDYWACA